MKDVSYYEALSDAEFNELPMEIVEMVASKMLEANKKPRSSFRGFRV